jgi:hypothetical protein
MDKNKGEAFFLLKRHPPYIGSLPDIDRYPGTPPAGKRVKYPSNNNKAHSVFNFEEFCFLSSPESLSGLFTDKKEDETSGGKISAEPAKEEAGGWDNYCDEKITGFLTGLSALTKKHGLVIHGRGESPSLSISKDGCKAVYPKLKYNGGAAGYEIYAFEKDGDGGEFAGYLKRQNIKCGFGWYGLVITVLVKLRRYNSGHLDGRVKISCFKEKHGKLHIAGPGGYPDSLKNIFENAKEASAEICEFCGGPGELKKRGNGEHKTLCPDCEKIHGESFNRQIQGGNKEEPDNNGKKRAEEKMRAFLSGLSALTRKYEVRVSGSFMSGEPPAVSDTGNRNIGYKNLEYDGYTGRYTAEGFGDDGKEEERNN